MLEAREFLPSFGRKRARGLSQTQKNNLIELYRIYGISEEFVRNSSERFFPQILFTEKPREIFFEIGFGHGEHLIKNAILNPQIGFIGCEPFENGVAIALKEIHEKDLKNVRIFKGDARILLNGFANNSLDRIYVLFPDPWPKKKHHKRRILSEEFLKYLKEHQPCDLIVATDCENYVSEVLKIFNDLDIPCCQDLEALSEKPFWFLHTKYEQKALYRGDRCYYLKVSLR